MLFFLRTINIIIIIIVIIIIIIIFIMIIIIIIIVFITLFSLLNPFVKMFYRGKISQEKKKKNLFYILDPLFCAYNILSTKYNP